MSAIFGLISRDGTPLQSQLLERMNRAMVFWGPDGIAIWQDGLAGLGQLRSFIVSGGERESLPYRDRESGVAFTAAGRIDNRDELIGQLKIGGDTTDGDLLFAAYRQWGEDAPSYIYGDWSFAAWHPPTRKLFLARDHFGSTALYYFAGPRFFAFASDRRALLALDFLPRDIDELYLAQILISWFAYHGQGTIYKAIRRLPPAHTLTVSPENEQIRQYWRLEETPELNLSNRAEYVAGFRAVFEEAVRTRLHSGKGAVAVALSGGLDSGAVAVTAARFLKNEAKRLPAYTAVTQFDPHNLIDSGRRIGNELPLAKETARWAGNIDLVPVSGTGITPIQAVRRILPVFGEPAHAAGNLYWIWELLAMACMRGTTVILTGQMGNAGISWSGDIRSQSMAYQRRQLGWQSWARSELVRRMPARWAGARRKQRRSKIDVGQGSAINSDFARRINLREQLLFFLDQEPVHSARDRRLQTIKPGRSFGGALQAHLGAAHGLEMRDPTADARVLAYAFSIPDHIFIDPQTGQDRWLIREAMRDQLPDQVRLNQRRGRQAADLVLRLRASASEVDEALDEVANGPAAAYVDVPQMRLVWAMAQETDTPETLNKTAAVLMRGIMAGLFVNQESDPGTKTKQSGISL